MAYAQRFGILTLAAAMVGMGCSASVGPAHHASDNPPPARTETVYTEPDPANAQPGAYRYPEQSDSSAAYDRAEDRVRNDYDRNYDRARTDRIPEDARAVGQKLVLGDPADTGLFFEPREDGRIFVRDEDTARVIYTGNLRRGQQFWLNMTREKATVDGHTVFQAPLRTGDQYQLYFQER